MSSQSRVSRSTCLVLSFFVMLAVSTGSSSGRTWYVQADGSGDAPTVQAGIDSAATGDVVLVGPGVYNHTTQVPVDGQSLAVNAHVTKDIVLRSEYGSAHTKIDASASAIGIFVEGVGSTGEVAGFEITAVPQWIGCVHFQENRAASRVVYEIAIRYDSSSASIRDNFIHDANTGILLNASPAPVFDNVLDTVGSGIQGAALSDADVHDNTLSNCGEGINFMDSSPRISRNKISRSNDRDACGGIFCGSMGPVDAFTPVISENNIERMMIEGIRCHTVTATVTGNILKRNYDGARLINSVIHVSHNVLIDMNTAIAMEFTTGTVENNTMDGNSVGMSIAASIVQIEKNIVFGGSAGISCWFAASPTLSCNDVFGMSGPLYDGCTDQTGLNGNFSADPQFCGVPGSGNYQLQSDSPCAPGNHPDGFDCGGPIGAIDAMCGTVSTKPVTWGAMKAKYRK